MKKSDFVLGIFSTIFGLAIYISADRMPDSAGAFPKLSASLLIGLGILMMIVYRVSLGKGNNISRETVKTDRADYKKVIIILVFFIIYIITFEFLGYMIPTFLLMIGVIYIAGYRNIKINLITSISITSILYLIFRFLFQVNFPKGIFF